MATNVDNCWGRNNQHYLYGSILMITYRFKSREEYLDWCDYMISTLVAAKTPYDANKVIDEIYLRATESKDIEMYPINETEYENSMNKLVEGR